MNKYFTVTVKPDILAARQHTAAFAANDVLFDWTGFSMPKGANRLISITMLVRGTDGAAQTVRDVNLFFAKTADNGKTQPSSIGTINSTADGTGYQNQIIMAAVVDNTDEKGGLDIMNVQSTGHGAAGNQSTFGVLEGERYSVSHDTTQIDPGKIKILVAATTSGSLDFRSGMQLNESSLDAAEDATLTVDGVSALTALAVGDVLRAHDEAKIGEIKSITDANTIVLKAANTAAIANNDYIYNLNPITLIFSFER